MANQSPISRKVKWGVVALTASLIIPAIWLIARLVNMYDYPLLGAIYELIWLPLILCLFVLPIFSFVFWMKSRFDIRSLFFYAFILSLTAIVLIVTS